MERAIGIVVIVVLAVATGAMYAVSMRANYLYGYGIGQSTDTKLAIAWANVAADVWKGFGLIVAAGLWRAKLRRAAVVISLTWLVCLCFSVSSAIGIYVQERTALTAGREAQHSSLRDTERELAEVEARLKQHADSGSVAELEAGIGAVLVRPVIVGERVRGTVATLSGNCSKHDARTAEACAEIAKLRTKLAAASERTRFEDRAAVLRNTIADLRVRGGAAAPDPTGEFWSWLTRGLFSVKDVGYGLPLAFALMIEMVSAFGPLGIVAYAETMRDASWRDTSSRVANNREASQPAATTLDSRGVGQLITYIADCTEPTESAAALGIDDLFSDYVAWCREGKAASLELEEFSRAFDLLRGSPELEGKIKKFGSRYFGIALTGRRKGARVQSFG
jgi:hypothetical protein